MFALVRLLNAHHHKPGGEPVWAHNVLLCPPMVDTVRGSRLSGETSKEKPPYALLIKKKKTRSVFAAPDSTNELTSR